MTTYDITNTGGSFKVITYSTDTLPSPYNYTKTDPVSVESGMYNSIRFSAEMNAAVLYGEGSTEYNKVLSELEAARAVGILKYKEQQQSTSTSELQQDFSGLAMFNDDSIVTEEAQGIKIDKSTGTWSATEVQDATDYMNKLATFENSLSMFKRVMSGKVSISEAKEMMTVVNDKDASFDENGVVINKKFKCPSCGKEVDLLLKNGYCSQACAVKERAKKALATVDDGAQRVLDFINMIKDKLALLDMILNIVTTLPELIKGLAKLPEEYRDYVMLRIDMAFLEIKRAINIVLIEKNKLLIQIVQKLKVGTLDSKLQVIFAPISAILTTIAAVQQTLNLALAVIMNLLDVPMTGIKPQSYGWMMTAKSMQYAETAGKLFVEIIPKMDLPLIQLPSRMCNIMQQGIDGITKVALPPIQEFEFLMPPEAFKIRFALSQDNTPRLKKMQEMLEALIVMGCDTFPPYRKLSLINIWFVLSILTGWGPLSRGVFGDFIFHGPM